MKGIHHRLHRCVLWRHRYPQIGEDIVVYPCPSETLSVLSVVKNVVEGIHHRWHRCGLWPTRISTDWGRYRCVSVSVEDGIRFISGSENTVR